MLVQYGDEKITYDQIGNPVSYRGLDMKWQGRQLCSISKENMESSYTYDYAGVRTSKTVNGVTTEYFLNGSQILAERTGSKTKCFFYDQAGTLVGMADSENKIYYYLYNLQGDVIAIADGSTGELAATYTYDAWGNCTVKNADGYDIGTENPFRYRGYYYDSESGLYYLGSRYYDSEVGRFINADGQLNGDLLGYNLYLYCGNNPVNNQDPSGTFWDIALDVVFTVGSLIAVAKNPTDLKAWAALGTDLICMAVPFVTGGGIAVRALSKADNVIDAKRSMNKYDDIGSIVKNKQTNYNKAEKIADIITGYTKHGLEQAIERDGVGVNPQAILDAIRNPKKTVTKVDELGRISTQYRGRMATVVLNLDKQIVSCWAKSSQYWRIKI